MIVVICAVLATALLAIWAARPVAPKRTRVNRLGLPRNRFTTFR